MIATASLSLSLVRIVLGKDSTCWLPEPEVQVGLKTCYHTNDHAIQHFTTKKTQPLKCGHPANQAILTGPKGGLISGSPLYMASASK